MRSERSIRLWPVTKALSPVAAAQEWQRDPCYRRVRAFEQAIALSPLLKDLPRIYDDVMSGRQPQVKR